MPRIQIQNNVSRTKTQKKKNYERVLCCWCTKTWWFIYFIYNNAMIRKCPIAHMCWSRARLSNMRKSCTICFACASNLLYLSNIHTHTLSPPSCIVAAIKININSGNKVPFTIYLFFLHIYSYYIPTTYILLQCSAANYLLAHLYICMRCKCAVCGLATHNSF